MLEWLTELAERVYLLDYWFITKDVLKDINEQPDQQIHRVRSGRVPGIGASVPVELWGMSPSWHLDTSWFTNLKAL